jgi:aspartate aminotransferase
MPSLSKRYPNLGTENAFFFINKAKAFEKELEAKGETPDLVYLQVGEPSFDTPAHIKEAGIKAIEDNHTHYSPAAGLWDFREAVAKYTSDATGVDYTMKDVVIVPGGKPVMFHMMTAVLDPGDEIIVPNPGYPIYESVPNFIGAKVVHLPLLEEKGYNFDVDKLESLITEKTKMIIVNSPQNPTGGVLNREAIARIAELAVKHDLWVLSDEIYDKIIYDTEHISPVSFPGMAERTVILNGCSKAFAMTGWRLGWAVIKNPVMLEALERVETNAETSAATMNQIAGIAAVSGPMDDVEMMKEEYRKRRDLLVSLVNEIPGMSCHSPEGAFYLFVNVKPILEKLGVDCEEFADRILKEARVLILPGTSFGSLGEGYIRFSYVSSEENIKKGCERIKEFINKIY